MCVGKAPFGLLFITLYPYPPSSLAQLRTPSAFRSFALLLMSLIYLSFLWHNVVSKLARIVSWWRVACDYVSFGIAIAAHFFGKCRSHLFSFFPNHLQCKRTITITLSCTWTCRVEHQNNEGPREWQNMFANMARKIVRYTEDFVIQSQFLAT